MASTDGNSDHSIASDSVQPAMTTIHSASYSGMPMHMYPFAPPLSVTGQPIRSKRRQVKNACTNCQKACKKCDDARPCLRCVKYGISEECVDSQRKERKKGIKRGPYKKRDGKGARYQLISISICSFVIIIYIFRQYHRAVSLPSGNAGSKQHVPSLRQSPAYGSLPTLWLPPWLLWSVSPSSPCPKTW